MRELSPCTGPRHHFLAAARVDWLASLPWQVDALPRLYPWREFKPPRRRECVISQICTRAKTMHLDIAFRTLWQICLHGRRWHLVLRQRSLNLLLLKSAVNASSCGDVPCYIMGAAMSALGT